MRLNAARPWAGSGMHGATQARRARACRHFGATVCAGMLGFLLAACANPPVRPPQLPSLRLDPALLAPGAWSQRLVFEQGARSRQFDALLEIDAEELRLVALAGPQEAFRLRWDGRQLETRQADWMPAEFRAEWVLDDLQLSLWPLERLRAALPAPWSIDATTTGRVLRHDGLEVVRIRSVDGVRRIEHPLQGYRLLIDSKELE